MRVRTDDPAVIRRQLTSARALYLDRPVAVPVAAGESPAGALPALVPAEIAGAQPARRELLADQLPGGPRP
jgi:hypothetical protein